MHVTERYLVAQGTQFDADAVAKAVAEGIAAIAQASSMEELKAIKTQYAGAQSAMTMASKAIGSLDKDQKKEAGKLMGKLRADFGRAQRPALDDYPDDRDTMQFLLEVSRGQNAPHDRT